MTRDLTALLAEAAEPGPIDLPGPGLLARARRRHHRRQVFATTSAAAAVLAVSLGAAALPQEDQPDLAGTAVVDACIGPRAALRATEAFTGLTVAQIDRVRTPGTTLVLARDGACLGRPGALREGQLAVVVDDSEVVWAAIEQPADPGQLDVTFHVRGSTPAVEACSELPGARRLLRKDPEIDAVVVRGGLLELAAVEGCLAAVPTASFGRAGDGPTPPVQIQPPGAGDVALGTITLPPFAAQRLGQPRGDLLASFQDGQATLYLAGVVRDGQACTAQVWDDPSANPRPSGASSCGPAGTAGVDGGPATLGVGASWSAPDQMMVVKGSAPAGTTQLRLSGQAGQDLVLDDVVAAGPRWQHRVHFAAVLPRGPVTISALDQAGRELTRTRIPGA